MVTARVISFFLTLVFFPASAQVATLKKGDHTPGVVWVKIKEQHRESIMADHASGRFKSKLPIKAIKSLAPASSKKTSKTGRAKKTHVDISLYYEIFFDASQPVDKVIKTLYATGYFEVVEPAYQVELFNTPNDPNLSQQYYLDIIKAYDAWDVSQGSESIVIGIVDSGGDLDHPDLVDKIYIDPAEPIDGVDNDGDGYIDNNRGWDFSGDDIAQVNNPDFVGDNDPSTKVSGLLMTHGTKVAGCAAATPNNATGIAGVGYKTKLLFTKHFSDNYQSNFTSDSYKGVIYAATHGAKIINCSWGGPTSSVIQQDIIKHVVRDLGCLVVAAAGNFKNSVPIYPASYDYVLSVAGSNSLDQKFPNSSFGKYVDITAPGFGIYTTAYDNTYASDNGTSLSSPIVAGAASLVWAKNPTFTALQVAEQLRASADETFYSQNPGYLNQLGKGRLNVLKALTMEIPSIRAANPVLRNNNDVMPIPGEDARLYLDFTNFLKPSSALTVTLSSASPYVTINNETINLGVVATFDTITNTSQPFTITIEPGFPVEQGVDLLLKFDDGVYHDYQFITIQLPSYIDVNENNITTSLTSIGRLGYANTAAQTNGSGFVYSNLQLLYEMGLIMGNAPTNLFNNVRGIGNNYDQDFTVAQSIMKSTPGERSSSEVFGAFRNGSVSGSESLFISYRSLVWKKEAGSHYNDFILLEYKIRNTTAVDINGFHFGIFADWDISMGGTNDKAAWNAATNLGYVFSPQNNSLPYTGIQVVNGVPNYYAIDNDPSIDNNPFGLYDDYTDAEKFSSISSGFLKTQAGDTTVGRDVSHVVSSGPHVIPAGEEITIVFALHGAPNLSDLLESAKYADSVYNYTLNAVRPTISDSDVCFGEDIVVKPEGASVFNIYKDFTGGAPLASGTEFTLNEVKSDSTFFVSNAENSYESVRTAVTVTVNPNPIAAFTVSGDLFSGQVVSFENTSSGAETYEWNFGDGNVATTLHASHQFANTGNVMVSLKAISDEGCEDSVTKEFVITGVSEQNENLVEVYPNPVNGKSLTVKTSTITQGNSRIELLNAFGQPVRSFVTGTSEITLDISDVDTGIYFLKIPYGHDFIIKKIIKRH